MEAHTGDPDRKDPDKVGAVVGASAVDNPLRVPRQSVPRGNKVSDPFGHSFVFSYLLQHFMADVRRFLKVMSLEI
jgi:hypothetical protein